jgi:serine/threonine-protein kinase
MSMAAKGNSAAEAAACRKYMSKKFDIDRGRWLAASPYLNQALDLPPESLDAWLQELAATQPAIAVDLRQLLAVQNDSFASFLSGQALPREDSRYSYQGEVIGNYRVLRELGSGGMAVVYLAERADGHFEQRVALKILRFGADSAEARRHFAQERQILASLDHPAIARLIDGGITAGGLPYLAMEYIEGVSIERFCDQRRLGINERLRLFLKVAEAVQYAHHHLIVHRDLKPSNIVVTHEGTVKLLDFGIAKLLDPDAFVHAAPPTRDMVRLMTPEYASPEQARGDPITTATDVYQLGRLLYELLTGRSPYLLRARNSLASLRAILESEPRRPSVCISRAETVVETDGRASLERICAARAITPERLRQTLRGDLDAILLMSLQKEPPRRYASVAQLGDDVERYLRRLPVNAYQGVRLYRAKKFLLRHLGGVVVAGLVTCTFVLLIAWYTAQLASERDRAAAEAQRARREAATAEQISEFLSSVFRGSDLRMVKADTTARELLDRGAERIEVELAEQPVIQARLLNVIGSVYAQYDARDRARVLIERALQLNLQQFGADSLEVADSKFALAPIIRDSGDLLRARRLLDEVLAVRERALGPEHAAVAHTLHALAVNLSRQGRSLEAIQLCERALEIYARTVSQYDERAVNARITLGAVLLGSGDLVRVRAHYEELVPLIERSLGAEHRNVAAALTNLATARLQLEDYQGVEQQLRRALAILQQFYAPDHSEIQIVLTTLATLYFTAGRFEEAVALYEQVIASSRRVGGARRGLEATAQELMGQLRRSAGAFEAARVHLLAATDIWRQFPGESRLRYAISLADYGQLLLDEGKASLATAPMDEAMAILQKMLHSDSYELASVLVVQGMLLARTGKAVESEANLRKAITIYRKVLPDTHSEVAAARSALGEALLAQGKLTEAEPILIASDQLLEQQVTGARRRSLQRLIRLHELKHDPQSVAVYRQRLAVFERKMRTA